MGGRNGFEMEVRTPPSFVPLRFRTLELKIVQGMRKNCSFRFFGKIFSNEEGSEELMSVSRMVYLTVCRLPPSIRLSIHLSVHPSIRPSVCPSKQRGCGRAYVGQAVGQSVHSSVCSSVRLYVCPSVCSSVCYSYGP